MDPRFEALQAEVTETTTVEASAVTLLNNLSTLLAEAIAAQDWTLVETLKANLDESNNALAAAVAANTPGA
jgi:hypothetical protein